MEQMMAVKVLGTRQSFYVHRVRIALHLKGVEYEFIEEDLDNKSQSLLLCNPIHKKVPVLLHGPNSVVESMIIVEYIDEVWKGIPILPADPYERAVARFWCHFLENKLRTSFREIARSTKEGKSAAIKAYRKDMMVLEDELRDGHFKGRKFFGGENIGIVDIVLGCGFHWIYVCEELVGMQIVDLQTFPLVTSWIENFKECKQVKEVLPPTRELIDYAKGLARKRLET